MLLSLDRIPRTAVAALLVALAVAGCGPDNPSETDPDDGPSCSLEFLGDPAAEPVIELVALDAGNTLAPIHDGSSIALIFPPQGGRVIFAGARATNVNPCAAMVTGVLRDPASGKTTFDGRTVNLEPLGDGWGGSDASDISTFSNIPVCPNQWATSDAYGSEFELKVTVKDRDGRSASKTVRVTPACAEPEYKAQCECICKHGYVLGEACDGDPASEPTMTDPGPPDPGAP